MDGPSSSFLDIVEEDKPDTNGTHLPVTADLVNGHKEVSNGVTSEIASETALDEISTEKKHKGERAKVSTLSRILHRKRSHIPKWNIYPTVHINDAHLNELKKFPSNRITTTKYTFYNFIPKNLFEQFRRATNIFFLLITIITFIPIVSPLTPITSILPFSFVLLANAIKEAYEDYLRYKADRKANNRKYEVVRNDCSKSEVASKDIKVGDIIYLKRNETIPADMVLLSSSLEDGVCYVETSQLDGESNLKILKALPQTASLSIEQLLNSHAIIECEEPHHRLYTFNARIQLGDHHTLPLETNQLLLRGASLRNTAWVYGVIIYAGTDTKLALNLKLPPSKFSTVERRMNRMVLGIFVFLLVCAVLCGSLSGWIQEENLSKAWYLNTWENESSSLTATYDFISYFVLFSFLIPMSLMVTLELVKISQAKLMEWDVEMFSDVNDSESGMKAKTSNLNDELALVKYIFSDKTGTLTENRMEFSHCTINGKVFLSPLQGELKQLLENAGWPLKNSTEDIDVKYTVDFLRALAMCHSVVAEEDTTTGEINYQAQSPDELALIQAAKLNGFVFKSRKNEGIRVVEQGEERLFPLLNLLEFTSERARSSVIVRLPEGKIMLYSKGADSKIFRTLSSDKSTEILRRKTLKQIDRFSSQGLRTLVVAFRELSEEEYRTWQAEYNEAASSLKDRSGKISKVCEKMERDLRLLGCTAIEDRLQPDVPDTIDYLLQSGIKVWIITGDKQQTAIHIGYSTKLLKPDQPKGFGSEEKRELMIILMD